MWTLVYFCILAFYLLSDSSVSSGHKQPRFTQGFGVMLYSTVFCCIVLNFILDYYISNIIYFLYWLIQTRISYITPPFLNELGGLIEYTPLKFHMFEYSRYNVFHSGIWLIAKLNWIFKYKCGWSINWFKITILLGFAHI